MNLVALGIEQAKKAVASDTAEDFPTAFRHYKLSLESFDRARRHNIPEDTREVVENYMESCLRRAEEIKLKFSEKPEAPAAPAPKSRDEREDDAEQEQRQSALGGTILRETPNVHWDDVAGLFEAKALLQETVIMPRLHPDLFVDGREPWRGVLLYGPPGTGKSYLAKAVATEGAPSTFFSVTSADLVSKWVGESEKHVQQLFQMARAHRPSVIFIDEVDALCRARGEGQESETARRTMNQLLLELDGVGRGMDGVLFLGATNMPWAIDPAMRRRFQKRVYVPLPDTQARAALFRIHLGPKRAQALGTEALNTLAELTEHYSGSDIANVVREALMIPLRIIQDATHFKRIGERWTPCSPGDPEGEENYWRVIPKGELVEPALTLSHFRQSIADTRPTVSADDLARFDEWTQAFGQMG
jgi:vacuolar protein-sorting-associated protein 4